jgi:general secretion pathway protein I
MRKRLIRIVYKSKAFTFVEILAAMLFMAILIPATIQGLLISNRAGIVAERKRTAAQLADNKLNEIILTEDWLDGEEEGFFSEDEDEESAIYSWVLEKNAWEYDTMLQITVKVYFNVQDRIYNVSLSTLVEEEESTE